MVKLLVTGHGEFANGMYNSLEMIAGKQEHVRRVVFEDGMDMIEYQNLIQEEITLCENNGEGLVICTDLLGGTPFNVSVLLTEGLENVDVIAGTNLPMLIEGSMLALVQNDALSLAQQMVQVGKNGIVNYYSVNSSDDENEDVEDGI